MKLVNIINAETALKNLIQKELPLKTVYQVSKLIKKCEEEISIYEKLRNDLIIKKGEEQEDGSFSIKDSEKLSEYYKEIDTLLQTSIEGIQKIKLPDDIKLTTNDFILLEEFLEVQE